MTAAIEQRLVSLENKANEQEKRLYALELKEAVSDEQYKVVISRLNKIDGHVSRLVWIVLAAIAMSLMKFILEGGLHQLIK